MKRFLLRGMFSKYFFVLTFINVNILFCAAQNQVTNLNWYLKDYAINRILTDPQGFLWIATDNGLVRFDGSTIINYVHDPNNPHSLSGNYVNDIVRDKNGKLWLATGNAGLSCFDPKLPKHRAFTNYHADINNPKALISNELYTMAIDEKGAIWLGGNEGHLVRFDPQTGLCQRFSDSLSSTSSTFYAMYYLGNGQLYLDTRTRGLALFDTQQGKITRRWELTEQLPKGYIADNKSISDFAFDATRNILWMASLATGLTGLDIKTGHLLPSFNFNMPTFQYTNWQNTQFAIAVSVAPNGHIWVGYRKGEVFIYDPETKKVLQNLSAESPIVQKALPFDLKKIQLDTVSGLMWIIASRGIFSYNLYRQETSKIAPLSKNFKELPITAAESKDSLVWMMDKEQLFAIDPHTGKKQKQYRLPPSIGDIMGIKTATDFVFLRGSSSFWVFTKKNNQFNRLLTQVDVSDVLLDSFTHQIWVSTYGKGLYRIAQNFEKIDSFFSKLKIITIQQDKNGNLWLGTDGQGAWRIKDKTTCQYEKFQNDPSVSTNTLPENVLISSYLDRKGQLWLGSMSVGLVLVENPESDKPYFKAFPLTSIGSPSIMVFREDSDGMLWLMTPKNEWYLFNPESHESLKMKAGDGGLPDVEWSKLRLIQGEKGIWALTTEGVQLLAASSLVFGKKKLHVLFTDFKIFERAASEHLLSDIRLSPNENYFTISFSAPDFETPNRIQYFYKLDGVDQNWRSSQTKKEISYTNLDGGTYTFRVRAVYGNDDPQNAEESSLNIVIEPHFWRTWWFSALLFLTIGAALFAFYSLKIKAVRQEAELKTEFNNRMAEVRISALRAQMNPHFIFNCLNTIEGFVLENKKWEASIFLQKFSKLIRLVLENAQFNVITLEQDLAVLQMYMDLEKVRFEGKFETHIKMDDALLDCPIPPMLFQPFVENAIIHGLRHRHTEGGYVHVNIRQTSNKDIECVIEDNGIGRKNAQNHNIRTENLHKTSIGLKVTEERLRIFSTHAVFKTEDAFPNEWHTGTKVTIVLPNKKKP